MPKGRPMRRANGTGTVVRLSGRRRCPYEVRVNTRIDEWGYPRFDVLGRFKDRTDALQALALYNNDPYSIGDRSLTFAQVYERWYKQKFIDSKKKYSDSTIWSARASFQKCAALHDRVFSELRTPDLQNVIDDFSLSFSYLRHICTLLSQLYSYAMQYELCNKDYSAFIKIQKEDDNKPGVPFSKEEIALLWAHVDEESKHQVTITVMLVLIYTGWRISEFLNMPLSDIDLEAWTMKGGVKTEAGKNRVVPIHSGIQRLVRRLYDATPGDFLLVSSTGNIKRKDEFGRSMRAALKYCGIETDHTAHDCRHTFVSLLDSAGANHVCIERLAGHASKGVTKKTYTHKDLDELRAAVELIQISP